MQFQFPLLIWCETKKMTVCHRKWDSLSLGWELQLTGFLGKNDWTQTSLKTVSRITAEAFLTVWEGEL